MNILVDWFYFDCVYKFQEYVGWLCCKWFEGKVIWLGKKQVWCYYDSDVWMVGDILIDLVDLEIGDLLLLLVMIGG